MREDIEREDVDTTAELSVDIIKQRAVRGVVVLTGRGFILNAISALSLTLLWAFLDQDELGVFAVAQAAVAFLSLFPDLGLGAALIQKKGEPSEHDLKTAFTVQQVFVLMALTVFILAAPWLAARAQLAQEGRILMYAFALSFFISSFRSIPTILLERKLEFVKYSIPTILDTLAYNLLLVFLAWRGFGITSFTYAVVARSIVGTVVIYMLMPWKPAIAFSKKSFVGLLRFGVPYQINNFISVIKDSGITLFLSGVVQTSGVGILDTSQRMINLPFRFFMDQVTKVAFPTFSRLQDDQKNLVQSVNRTLFFVSLLTFPVIAGLVISSPLLFSVIPQYQKWLVAVPLLPFLAINAYFATVSNPLYNLLYAIGKVRQTMYLMIMWATLTWLFVPPLALRFGIQGVAIALSLVGASSIVTIVMARKYVPFSLWHSFGKPLLSAIVMTIILLMTRPFLPNDVSGLGILIIIGASTYSAAILALVGVSLIQDAKKFIEAFRSK